MTTGIGIQEEHAARVAKDLSILLADEFVLYTKTRNAHWNVVDNNFHAIHKFFEEQYEMLDEFMDEVAERIRVLNHFAPATLNHFLQLTHLSEVSRENNDSQGFIKELLSDHESVILFLRGKINLFATDYHDLGSSDFITGLMEKHEKMAWMLRASLS